MRNVRWAGGAVAVLLGMLVAGCIGPIILGVIGSGVAGSATRDVGGYSMIEMRGVARLEVTIGPAHPVEITGDDNIVPLVETVVDNGTLVVRDTTLIHPTLPLVVKVTVPDVSRLLIVSAADAVITGVNNAALTIDISGVGRVSVSGQTQSLTVNVTGTGHVSAEDLTAAAATVFLAGTGRVDVTAVNTLDVTIIGAGLVTYAGSPTISQIITGLGSLQQRS